MKTTTKHRHTWFAAPAIAVLLASCGGGSDVDFAESKEQGAAQTVANNPPEAIFDPRTATIPIPSNLLFSGTTDGTLNINLTGQSTEPSNPSVALNQLNGFSTVAPIVAPISEPVKQATLILGQTVRVFEVTTGDTPETAAAVTGFVGELSADAMNVIATEENILLVPKKPLKPSTSYMAVLTNGIQDMSDTPMAAGFLYNILKGEQALADPQTEGLRQIIGSHLAVLRGAQAANSALNIDTDNIVLSWHFTTQSIREVLQAAKDNAIASELKLAKTELTTKDQVPALQGIADIYQGSLTLPYYLTALNADTGPLGVINGFWKNAAGNVVGAFGSTPGLRDYTPVKTSDVVVPVLMTLPNGSSPNAGAMPANGWPVTIFAHGFGRDRTDMLLIAETMASVGRAVIAIDFPLHGLADSANKLHASSNPLVEGERTFDLDLVTVTIDPDTEEVSTTPGPDSAADPSGTHFMNLADLANARDNLRQGIADMFVLTASLPSAEVEGVTLDPNGISFVGHSLGAILGTTMLSYETNILAGTLAMPGGGLAQLLANSSSFTPRINASLAGSGVLPGTADYERFFIAAQTLLDPADPINHASTLSNNATPGIHLIEVVGDATVPNLVPGPLNFIAPLAGTEPLISELGLPAVAQSISGSSAAVRFTAGDHGSIINPKSSAAATAEMQQQMARFAVTNGSDLTITNESILQLEPVSAQ